MNYIVGFEINKDEIIDKIFNDYCEVILDENVTENYVLIENYFSIKKIIFGLAEK